MENKKKIYFQLQIALSGWLTGHYNFRCQPVDYSNHPKTLRVRVQRDFFFEISINFSKKKKKSKA